MAKWFPYLKDLDGKRAPFLLARLVSPQDTARRPVFVDAKLDTGTSCCGVPVSVIEQCVRAGIPVAAGQEHEFSGAFGPVNRRAYWFHATLFPSEAPRASLTDHELERYSDTARVLYCTKRDSCDNPVLGLRMVATDTDYALIGHSVLAHWTVILHGRSSHFKVMDRGGRWFIFSLAPR
ncbi:MAG: hypothetical protein FJ291_06950 [Planctomycetes bacterium]|nr:hypothetical protein [Planctomycetota bacterium]